MANENIFREVDEELRSERMRAFWKKAGPIVIGAAVLVVLLVAVNEGWRAWQNSQSAASSERLYAAFALADAGDVAGARTALADLAETGAGGYPTLARFREAGLLAANGDVPGAVAVYDALAGAESDARLRELALVLAGHLLVDTGTPEEVEARVGAIAVDGNPLRNAAREALGLAQYRAGNPAGAQARFEVIIDDPGTTQGQRTRAGFYVAQMVAEGAIAPEPALVEALPETVEDLPVDEAEPAAVPASEDTAAPAPAP